MHRDREALAEGAGADKAGRVVKGAAVGSDDSVMGQVAQPIRIPPLCEIFGAYARVFDVIGIEMGTGPEGAKTVDEKFGISTSRQNGNGYWCGGDGAGPYGPCSRSPCLRTG